jgi:hypothetical protein
LVIRPDWRILDYMRDDPLRAGIEALRVGHIREARRLFGELVREQPDNAAAWWYLAAVLNDPEQKAHCLRQVLRLLPDHAEARQMLADLDRQVARPTPPGGLERPVMEALEARDGLVATPPPQEQPLIASPHPLSEARIMLAAGVVALLAIVGTTVLIMMGTISDLLGIEGPPPTPSPRPINFGVPTCIITGDSQTTAIFINNTDSTIDLLRGPEGQEEFLLRLAPGAQGTVEVTQPGTEVRYVVRTDTEDVAGSSARYNLPRGNTCHIPLN